MRYRGPQAGGFRAPDVPPASLLHELASLFNAQQFDAFARKAKDATRRWPASPVGWKALGNLLLMEGKYRDAAGALAKAARLAPDDAQTVHNLGAAQLQLGSLDEAAASFRAAIARHPGYFQACTNLGIALLRMGRLDDAEASLRRALELQPGFALAYNSLGNVLLEQGRPKDAAACFHAALASDPDFAEAHSNLGQVALGLGRADEAAVCFGSALRLRPDLADAQRGLGDALRGLGRQDEALAAYRAYLGSQGDWKAALARLTKPLIDPGTLVPSKAGAKARSSSRGPDVREEPRVPLGPPAPVLQSPRRLRIALVYPPLWGAPLDGPGAPEVPLGPPRDAGERRRYTDDVPGDMRLITYGLLTIAAQARRAGHDVSVHNLFGTRWEDIVALVRSIDADVWGISSFLSNRRGMGAVAELIRKHHPRAHITVGGHFPTALPVETLEFYPAIDTVVVGEGEETFLDLVGHVGAGRPAAGIPGTAWRQGAEVVVGPPRPFIKDLDALASPFDHYTSHIVMTSRGCPAKCTFCGSYSMWRQRVRFHSAAKTVELFRKALDRLQVPVLLLMDDTFTTHRKRALEVCDAIIQSGMRFIWGCNTRVDCVDDELLRKMRLAGCQSIFFGVESGDPEILKGMRKNTDVDATVEATRAAKAYGYTVGYYMIIVNRGETPASVERSVELIRSQRPSNYWFSPICFFPGAEDWQTLRQAQGLGPDVFFRNDFVELTAANGRRDALDALLLHAQCEIGALTGFDYGVDERERVARALPELDCVHVELAQAYFRAGRPGDAEAELVKAERLGFPVENILINLRACMRAAAGDARGALELLDKVPVPDKVVVENFQRLKRWMDGPAGATKPRLSDSVDAMDYFSLFDVKQQFDSPD
jgi:radical SAM superfamily enzyme YgiQ (UPF0313 family)/predicted Zn-dependent protease